MQVKLSEQTSMKLIVHLFDTGLLTDENNINPKIVGDVLSEHYSVKLVAVREGKKTFEALQGLERDIMKILNALMSSGEAVDD